MAAPALAPGHRFSTRKYFVYNPTAQQAHARRAEPVKPQLVHQEVVQVPVTKDRAVRPALQVIFIDVDPADFLTRPVIPVPTPSQSRQDEVSEDLVDLVPSAPALAPALAPVAQPLSLPATPDPMDSEAKVYPTTPLHSHDDEPSDEKGADKEASPPVTPRAAISESADLSVQFKELDITPKPKRKGRKARVSVLPDEVPATDGAVLLERMRARESAPTPAARAKLAKAHGYPQRTPEEEKERRRIVAELDAFMELDAQREAELNASEDEPAVTLAPPKFPSPVKTKRGAGRPFECPFSVGSREVSSNARNKCPHTFAGQKELDVHVQLVHFGNDTGHSTRARARTPKAGNR